MLATVTPLMCEALASSRRVWLYLNERGIPPTLARASNVGYLTPSGSKCQPSGDHFSHAGSDASSSRSLLLTVRAISGAPCSGGNPAWMRTRTRRCSTILAHPGAGSRPTRPAGSADTRATQGPLILVEGGFDRLALLSAGMPAESVIALVGTAARPSWLPRSAPRSGVVLALDADSGGEEAMARLAGEFQQAGLVVSLCPPPRDKWGKDWSERWRRLGPQSLWPLYEALARQQGAWKEGAR